MGNIGAENRDRVVGDDLQSSVQHLFGGGIYISLVFGDINRCDVVGLHVEGGSPTCIWIGDGAATIAFRANE